MFGTCALLLSVNHMLCLLQQKIIFYKMCSWGDSRCQRVGLKGSGAQGNSPFPFFFQDSRGLKPVQEDTPQLMRTRSDVGVRRRGNVRTSSDQRRIRRHRFSINGHFYNHKVKGPWRKKTSETSPLPGVCYFSAMWSLGTHLGSQGFFSSV